MGGCNSTRDVTDIKNDDDAGNYYLALIRESVNERYRILDNLIHNCIHID